MGLNGVTQSVPGSSQPIDDPQQAGAIQKAESSGHAHAKAEVTRIATKRLRANLGAVDQGDNNDFNKLLEEIATAHPQDAKRLQEAGNGDDAEFDELQANVSQMTQADQERFNSAVEDRVNEGGGQGSGSDTESSVDGAGIQDDAISHAVVLKAANSPQRINVASVVASVPLSSVLPRVHLDMSLNFNPNTFQFGQENPLLPPPPDLDQPQPPPPADVNAPQPHLPPDLNKPQPAIPRGAQAKEALQSAANFVSNNTPDVAGGSNSGVADASAVASAASALGVSVPNSVSLGTGVTAAGSSALSDIRSLFNAGKEMPENWHQMKGGATDAAQAKGKREFKEGLVNHFAEVVDLGAQGTSVAGQFVSTASVAGANLAGAIPILGAGVGLIMGTKSAVRLAQAKTSRDQLDKTLDDLNRIQNILQSDNATADYQNLFQAATFARGQMQKKFVVNSVGVAGATATTTGGIAAGAGAITINPVLAGAGVVVGAVGTTVSTTLGGYKAARNVYKRGTNRLGVDRELHAHNLMGLLGNQSPNANDNGPAAWRQRYAEQVVRDIGLNPDVLRTDPNIGEGEIQTALKSS
jgi:hypothetical protein